MQTREHLIYVFVVFGTPFFIARDVWRHSLSLLVVVCVAALRGHTHPPSSAPSPLHTYTHFTMQVRYAHSTPRLGTASVT